MYMNDNSGEIGGGVGRGDILFFLKEPFLVILSIGTPSLFTILVIPYLLMYWDILSTYHTCVLPYSP